MFEFYTRIIGLSPMHGDECGPHAVLRGTVGTGDVTLLQSRPGIQPGLHHVGIEVSGEENLDRALNLLQQNKIVIEWHVEHEARRAVNIADSSGIMLQFFVNRTWQPRVIANVPEDTAAYLL